MLSAIISALIALGTTLVTLHFTHKNDVKKWVLEKRAEIYFEYYDQLEEVLIDKNTVFSEKYRDSLSDMKPQMKLIASKETFNRFKEYYEFVCGIVREYDTYSDECDPEQDPSMYEEIVDDNEKLDEISHITELDLELFWSKMEKYREDKIKKDGPEIEQKIEKLYQAMRDDLGSNLKR